MLTVYGIKQCDTCKKAVRWLTQQGIEHRFHDLRDEGLDPNTLQDWLTSEFSGVLVNRRSTTWRQLDGNQRQALEVGGLDILLKHPTLIKRLVFTAPQVIAVGFNAATEACVLEHAR